MPQQQIHKRHHSQPQRDEHEQAFPVETHADEFRNLARVILERIDEVLADE